MNIDRWVQYALLAAAASLGGGALFWGIYSGYRVMSAGQEQALWAAAMAVFATLALTAGAMVTALWGLPRASAGASAVVAGLPSEGVGPKTRRAA